MFITRLIPPIQTIFVLKIRTLPTIILQITIVLVMLATWIITIIPIILVVVVVLAMEPIVVATGMVDSNYSQYANFQCQVCFKFGHITVVCHYRYDSDYQLHSFLSLQEPLFFSSVQDARQNVS